MINKLLIVVLLVLAVEVTVSGRVHPSPQQEVYLNGQLAFKSICHIYHESSLHHLINSQYYFRKIIKRINHQLECPQLLTYQPQIYTQLSTQQRMDFGKEGYELLISQEGIKISYGDYSGYVYALETLAQLVQKDTLPFAHIVDAPVYPHRGIMIDTARHFIQIDTITRLIQTMPVSKLNILHWHMIDDEAFSVKLQAHPQLSQYGSQGTSKVYTVNQIKNLIILAQRNGIKIIPQIGSPSRMRSWIQSPNWSSKNITIKCNATNGLPKYCHQLDPSKTQGLQLLQEVVVQLDDIFRTSPYIHLGGDRVNYNCWDSKPSLKTTFMPLHNIKNYDGLTQYIRFQVKQAIPSSRKVIYWIDQAQKYKAGNDDILQFKGNIDNDLAQVLSTTTNKIILSGNDYFDLSAGLGDIWSNASGIKTYATWRKMHENFNRLVRMVDPARLLGAQLLAWGNTINDDTLENNVWMRGAVFGQCLWSSCQGTIWELLAAMVKVQRLLEGLQIQVSPLTGEYCQYNPQTCFPINSADKSILIQQ